MHTTPASMLLRRMRWHTASGELDGLKDIAFGPFRFRFRQPLEKQVQYDFLGLAERLDLADPDAILVLGAWLMQHGARFRIGYKHRPGTGFRRNVLYLSMAAHMDRLFRKYPESVLQIDLSGLPETAGCRDTAASRPARTERKHDFD